MIWAELYGIWERIFGPFDKVWEWAGDHLGATFELVGKAGFRLFALMGFLGFLVSGNPVMLLAPLGFMASMMTIGGLIIFFVDYFIAVLALGTGFVDDFVNNVLTVKKSRDIYGEFYYDDYDDYKKKYKELKGWGKL